MHGILDYLQSKGYKITVVVVSGYRIVGRDIFRLAGRVWVKSELTQWLSRLPGRALDLLLQDAGRHVDRDHA